MRSRKKYLLILIFLVETLGGCAPDAPHDNPTDPGYTGQKTDGVVSGIILSRGLHFSPVANALVALEEDGAAEYTDANGAFSFESAPSGSITFVVSKPAYMSDTTRALICPPGCNSKIRCILIRSRKLAIRKSTQAG